MPRAPLQKAAHLRNELTDLQNKKAVAIAQATQNGVADAEVKVAAADKDYSRAMSLQKVGKSVETASGDVRYKGVPEPGRFATVLDNATNKKLLTRALGGETVDELQDAAQSALRNKTVRRVAAGVAGLASADVIGRKALHALSGDGK